MAALSTPTPAALSIPHPPLPPHAECQLLGPFALLVQLALGGLALMALVYKRWRERPQRPVKVWAFDVSKQVVGSVVVHVANLVMSMLSSGQFGVTLETVAKMGGGGEGGESNSCSFYFLNLLIDTTIGIPILIFLLHLLTRLFLLTPLGVPPASLASGHYGTPPKATWWAKQSVIYFLGLLAMKLVVLLIFILLPWISAVGDWALRWTEGDEKLQVGFVMLFFPLVMNATQYYIIDGFIKGRMEAVEGGMGVDVEGEEGGEEEGGEEDGLLGLGEEEVVVVKHTQRQPRQAEYDEQRDGLEVRSASSSNSAGAEQRERERAKLMTESEEEHT